MHNVRLMLTSYVQRNVGFAFFLAWNYIALYGCGMAIGTFVPYNLEYIWIFAGAAEFVCALVGLVLVGRGLSLDRPMWGVVAATCAVLGNGLLWLSYFIIELYWTTFAFSGICLGVGIVLMTVVWGSRLAKCDFSKIEFDVLLSFLVAFALYCVTLPIKLYGTVDLTVASALPVLSMVFAFRGTMGERVDEMAGEGVRVGTGMRKDGEGACGRVSKRAGVENAGCLRSISAFHEVGQSITVFVTLAMLWFLIAFLRVVMSPLDSYDRFQHYFFPFFFAFLVVIAFFVVIANSARYLSFTLTFRWALPFMLLGLGVLSLDMTSLNHQIVAYAMNFGGMFGVQIASWMAVSKYLRRSGGMPTALFLGFAASEGLGIVLGCGLGLFTVARLSGSELMAFSLFVMAGGMGLIMMLGFNPTWRSSGWQRVRGSGLEDVQVKQVAPNVGSGYSDGKDDLSTMIREKATRIQQDYGLTERETEIVELLLAGRSRPYIRDELLISLNTVHTHASNIFAKCQVHSQQELIDLAYKE